MVFQFAALSHVSRSPPLGPRFLVMSSKSNSCQNDLSSKPLLSDQDPKPTSILAKKTNCVLGMFLDDDNKTKPSKIKTNKPV